MKIKFALRVGAWVVALGSASYTFAAPDTTRLTDAKAAANDGLKIYSSVVAPDQARGVWAFGTTGYNPQSISINHDIMATAGGFEANGLYYINRYISMAGIEEMRTISYYTSDWSEYDNFRTDYISYMATTIAYSYERDEAYGCFFDNTGEGYNFVRWNYEYYSPKAVIRNLERPWCACAFDGQGNLYALERNGDLYAVKTMNGEMTLIGHTGIESALSGDAAIDPATNTLYWAVANPAGNDVSSALYSVDLTSATATKLYDMAGNEQLCGMYIPREAATSPLLAPFRANSMTPRLTFSGNSLSGTFTFKSPYCNNDYDPLPTDEELTYTVKANGKVVATGTCLPNKQIDVPIELTESDNYYFTVTTANEYGTSLPTAADKKFIGYDIPSAPTFNTPTVNGSTVSLSWRAPSTTGLNGGKIDASTCAYSVVRYPDMKQVATNITGTNVTDELPDPDVYTEYYYVLSTLAGTAAAPDVTSAKIGVGPVEPPHTWAFNSSAAVGEWTYEGKKPTYSSYYTALSLDASWESFDDWIFSPAVAVKNGGIYPVALTIFGGDNYMTEDVEVKWGTAPTAEAMTNTVVESTQYSGSDEKELTGELTSSVTGKIYIGVHISTTTSSYAEIYYKSVTIGEGVITGAPEAPAEFNAEATAPGAHNVAVSFNIPQYNVGGAPLADDNAITKVEIVRDGTPIYTLSEGIVPGAKVEYTDRDVAVGTHTYAALAYNNYGEGEKASKELFVGVAKPLAPASVVMIEDGNTGSVTLTWDPVVTGVDDSTLPEGSVTYRVINRSYETVADKIEDTTLTIQAVDGDTQAFVQFGVYAVTEGGESENMTATQYKPAGKPYTAPWKESFANENVSSIWGYNYIKGSERWQFIASMSDFNLQPQDDDHGFAYFEVDGGSLTSLVSGKIDLSTIASPAFSYYTFNYNGLYNNTLTLEVDKNDGKGFVAVQSNVVAQTGPVGQWNKVVVPLKDFEGETVVFRITPSVPEMIFYTLDNLRVATHAEKNLSITKISAPTVAEVNKPFEVEVNVTNSGDKSMSAYSVELLNGENVIATVTPSSLEPDATRTSTFEVTLGITDGEYAYLSARIVSTEDMVETDNISEVVEVGINTPKTPVVTDLKAIGRSTAVELTWSEPDLDSALPAAYTETFESATSWNSIVEGWKFYDKDDTPVGGIETPGFPCTGLQSWFVADHSWNGFPTNAVGEWAAHSGEKFLASEYVVKGNTFVQSDDWAITPRLSTVSQVLSFYAKSFKKEFPETIEVLASSNTTNVDDFVSLYTFNNLPVAWTQIRVKLPEGTKYAAIRSRSIDRFFVFVDDVTFIPSEGTPEELVISGYNVYRNGVKITAKPVTATTYSDTAGSDTAEYFVTTVYTTGESGASNTAIPEVDSSLKDLTDNDNVTISATGGVVTVKGLTEGYVTITAIDGRTIFKCEAQPVVNVPLASGVYIVSAGNKVAKLLVK